MSFMFHPYPYVDHDAVNVITGRGVNPVKGGSPRLRKSLRCSRMAGMSRSMLILARIYRRWSMWSGSS